MDYANYYHLSTTELQVSKICLETELSRIEALLALKSEMSNGVNSDPTIRPKNIVLLRTTDSNKLSCIKAVRTAFMVGEHASIGLKEAKDIVDNLQYGNTAPLYKGEGFTESELRELRNYFEFAIQ